MLYQLADGSDSNPAVQYWIDKRDAARKRYNDAQSEIFRLKPLVSSAKIRYSKDKATMRGLESSSNYAAEWESLHLEYVDGAQRRIDKIDEQIRKYLGN